MRNADLKCLEKDEADEKLLAEFDYVFFKDGCFMKGVTKEYLVDLARRMQSYWKQDNKKRCWDETRVEHTQRRRQEMRREQLRIYTLFESKCPLCRNTVINSRSLIHLRRADVGKLCRILEKHSENEASMNEIIQKIKQVKTICITCHRKYLVETK